MNRKGMLLVMTVVLGVLVATLAGPTAEIPAAQAAQAAQEAAAMRVVYLPIISRNSGMISGRVTESGAAAAGVPLSLRFFDGSGWSTKATTQTDGTGAYQFSNQPTLGGGQRYQVAFENTAGHDGRLAWWGTRHLTSYAAGANIQAGDFDLAAVALADPPHEATVGLPVTFRWTRRPASTTDSYAVRLYDPADLNPLYVAPYVGYGESFTLSSLPGGFSLGSAYTWDVILLAPDGATGVSRQARSLRFASGITGRVMQNGTPAGSVPLQLRFFNGTAWSTLASATTAADGTYAFTSAPTLGAGQKYYVRYQNVTQTAGRLFLWSTRTLTAYTAGTALDLGSFDIGDVGLVSPPGGATVTLPNTFQWTRRSATPSDSYILELYDPSDYQPRWLSALRGYTDSYLLDSLAPALSTNTPYAWDVLITSPGGGSGVSRLARLVQFANRGVNTFAAPSADWPFEEELPPRPSEGIEGAALLTDAEAIVTQAP
jgi:hypothetical protein